MSQLTLANRLWPQAGSSNLLRKCRSGLGGQHGRRRSGANFSAYAARSDDVANPRGAWHRCGFRRTSGCCNPRALCARRRNWSSGLCRNEIRPCHHHGAHGGYLLGFILAAALVGWLAERGFDRSVPKMLIAMLVGAAVLYVPGLLWLGGVVAPSKRRWPLASSPSFSAISSRRQLRLLASRRLGDYWKQAVRFSTRSHPHIVIAALVAAAAGPSPAAPAMCTCRCGCRGDAHVTRI